mmetsp:Transcript_13988/g.39221  ORF Transcript_13988/g.39221 Transcript_13988/m.39221 type:complete len:90 (-) Transcript_13988:1635-1904(-)
MQLGITQKWIWRKLAKTCLCKNSCFACAFQPLLGQNEAMTVFDKQQTQSSVLLKVFQGLKYRSLSIIVSGTEVRAIVQCVYVPRNCQQL